MLLTIISFVLVLGVLVFFHELGHYWAARRNGIVVEEFGMGYPPRLAKLFTYDGTDFTINALPLGGFARMKGEDAGDMSPGSFNAASRVGRAMTLLAGPAMNALLAIIFFALTFLVGFPASVGHPQITTAPDNSAAAAAGLQPGDILLTADGSPALVSAIPDFDFQVLKSANPQETETTDGLLVSREGSIISLPLTGSSNVDALLRGSEYAPVLDTGITLIAPDSPAEAAGIQAGDLVYAVDGQVITADNSLVEFIQAKAGSEITLTILRGDEWLDINVTPRVDPPPGEGALGIQITTQSTLARLSIPRAIWEGVRSTFQYFWLVLQLPVQFLLGRLSPAEAQISGPVGIAQMVGGAMSATINSGLLFPILQLTAVLSAALAIMNLLPIPALDGGRLLFIIIEALRGRRINPEREGFVHMVGFMLLLGLLVIVTFQDIRSAPEAIDWLSLLGQ
ncbi:MAG: RIP metalloprotease RseP [Caldilineaceae bacterium]|nr:RIP metalloprotease RseP [Caldilineaceae bacterium]